MFLAQAGSHEPIAGSMSIRPDQMCNGETKEIFDYGQLHFKRGGNLSLGLCSTFYHG